MNDYTPGTSTWRFLECEGWEKVDYIGFLWDSGMKLSTSRSKVIRRSESVIMPYMTSYRLKWIIKPFEPLSLSYSTVIDVIHTY